MKNVCTTLYIAVILICITKVSAKNGTDSSHEDGHSGGIHIFKFDFGRNVATPFVVCCWVLLASLAKIVFHHYEKLSSTIPESCLLILLGIPIGLILQETELAKGDLFLTSNLFFYFLLPPIILDAGYFMPSQVFYLNIGTILLYAVFGTIFNAFAVGTSLYAVGRTCDFPISLLQALLFGSLISAVDPVAVLAVFEEVHVHEVLYMLVFGESVLNDAASVVLYRTFESLVGGTVDAEQVGLGIASFFVVSLGGTMIGVIFALLTSFITKFTEHVRVIEPVFVFLMSYMAYLCAEIFHFSGIMSILFCGIVMKPYVESNMSRKSHTTIKYFLKLLSSSCDSIIFMFLGASLVQYRHMLNPSFLCFTLLFITVYRAIGVTMLTFVANKCGRLTKVKKVEQFIMSYGGLRGAVAFCLAMLIREDDTPSIDGKPSSSDFKQTIVTTTISVVLFTCFIQGTTIKKLVDILGVKKSFKRDKSMAETVNDRMLGYMVAGIEEIIGVHGHGFWRNLLELFNKKYLRRWLERDPDNPLDDSLLAHQRRIAFKCALEYAHNPSMVFARQNDGETLNNIKKNASVAMQLALRAQEKVSTSECGVLDMNALSDRTIDEESFCSDAFNPRSISSLIPKARKQSKKTYSKRKYTLNSLDEEEAFEDRFRKIHKDTVQHPSVHRSSHKHHHHRKSRRHSKGHRSKGRSKSQTWKRYQNLRKPKKLYWIQTQH
ncbi:sodium/hydrogen exchanger 3-like [Clytia hemisphaerica]|uniref:Sodium/hydrogen exchanger n=1 Tax=Clytia hemisphaerica TaxID=252671 RepID=A0A7M5UT42_9CNID